MVELTMNNTEMLATHFLKPDSHWLDIQVLLGAQGCCSTAFDSQSG
jgi:hypothetical protein